MIRLALQKDPSGSRVNIQLRQTRKKERTLVRIVQTAPDHITTVQNSIFAVLQKSSAALCYSSLGCKKWEPEPIQQQLKKRRDQTSRYLGTRYFVHGVQLDVADEGRKESSFWFMRFQKKCPSSGLVMLTPSPYACPGPCPSITPFHSYGSFATTCKILKPLPCQEAKMY